MLTRREAVKGLGAAMAGILIPQDYQMPEDMKGKRKKVRPEDLRSGTLYGQYQLRGSILTIKDASTTASGFMAFGTDMTTIPTSATTGTGIYIDYTGIYGLASNVQQAYMSAADGKIYAGAGAVTLGINGIEIVAGTSLRNGITWVRSGTSTVVADLLSVNQYAVANRLELSAYATADNVDVAIARLNAKNTDLTQVGQFGVYALASSTYAMFKASSGTLTGFGIGVFPSSLLHIASTAPTFRMEDTTASAKSLLVTTDANLTKFEEAGGAANGLLVLDLANARVGIGTASPGQKLDVRDSDTNLTASRRTLYTQGTYQQQTSSNFNNYAFLMEMERGNDSGITNTFAQAAGMFSANIAASHAGSLSNVWGVASYGAVRAGATGSIGEYVGFYTLLTNGANTATISSFTGLKIANPVLNGASLSNLNGILIENLTAGSSNNYAIYTNAGRVHFGDSVDLSSGKNITLSAGNIITDTTTGTKIGTSASQKLGFYNATPIVRPSAYTQTYSTADKTHATPTAATLTDSSGGTANTTLQAIGATYSQTAVRNNFADLAAMVNKNTADHLDLAQLVNALIDDLQALGLVG